MTVINPWYQLGYIIPHIYTDMDAYQFYRVAPEGMMLVTTGFDLAGHSLEAVERELPTFWRCVDTLAKKKVDRIALSGVPVASVLGRKRMREILAEAETAERHPLRHGFRGAHRGARALRRDPHRACHPLARIHQFRGEALSRRRGNRGGGDPLPGDDVRGLEVVPRGRGPRAGAQAGRRGAARGARCAGAADAGRPVARHARRARSSKPSTSARCCSTSSRRRARRSRRRAIGSRSSPIRGGGWS